MYKNKIIYGLDNIHYCKINENSIKELKGALSINVELSQESVYGKINGYNLIRIDGECVGTGTLTVLNLSLEEQADLFGYDYNNGELAVGKYSRPNNVRLLFSRSKADDGKLYTIFYNCVFKKPNIDSETLSDELNEENLELEFDVLIDNKSSLQYFTLDTLKADKNKVDNFFNEIQFPTLK